MDARLRRLETSISKRRELLSALDTTIRLTEKRLAADAAGTVHAHAPEYKKRGALKAFIVASLRAAVDGIEIRTIAAHAVAHFGLVFESTNDFNRFLVYSVQSQVRRLQSQGLVEFTKRLEKSGAPALWRWKSSAATFADLVAAQQAATL